MSESEKARTRTLRPVAGKLGGDGPVVYEYKPSKRKAGRGAQAEPEYSPELADVQEAGTDAVHAARRAADALAKTIDTYERERNKSMREKKDGAIEDFIYNSGKAASVWLKETSDIPAELAESARRSDYPKRLRKRLRRVSKALRNWQM